MSYPKILHDNRFDDGDPVASTTAAGYDVRHVRDWRPYTRWKPSATPSLVQVDTDPPSLDLNFVKATLVGVGGTPTLTRDSTATYFDSAGVLQTAAVNAPRFDYDPVALTIKGLLIEESRTNVVLHDRDLTNAAWTKTNVTAAKNQTGIDGVAASASSITATAANGTVLQAIVLASSARFQTAYVKRLTGSGTVEMTMDGGTTWTPIAVTGAWTRVSIPTQTLANPNVGFRLVTSGDAIAVDLVQNENGTFATSAIPTTTDAVTRAKSDATLAYAATAGNAVVVEAITAAGAGTQVLASFDDGTANERVYIERNSANEIHCIVVDGGVTQADLNLGVVADNATIRVALGWSANDIAACLNGGTAVADSSATLPTVTTLRLGENHAAANQWNGHVRRIRHWPTRKPNAQLVGLTGGSTAGTGWTPADYGLVYAEPGTYEVRGSVDNFQDSNSLLGTITLTETGLGAVFFASAVYPHWGVKSTTGVPAITIASIGRALEMPSYLDSGFDPMGREPQGQINVSEAGHALGSVTRFEEWSQSLKFPFVTWAWLRDTWQPAWAAHLRDEPFVFAWDSVGHADELRLVMRKGGYKGPHSPGSYADLSFDVSGIA